MSKNISAFLDSPSLYIGIIFVVSVLVILPVLIFGIPFGSSDFTHHLQLSIAYFDGFQQGILYPNWVSNENNGYGAITVRFYPPLTHYVMAIFRLISGNWQSAIFLSLVLWSFVGGCGMYLWAKDILQSKWQALIASLLFIIAPYHLNQFYNAQMLAEFVFLAIIPFCFYYSKKVCIAGKLTDVLSFSIAVSFLILSNLPQLVIGAICVGFYTLFYLERKNLIRQILKLAVAGLLSLLCSSFYWVRIIGEVQWLNIYQTNTDPNYDYRNHFLLSNFQLDEHGIWFASLMFVFMVFCMFVSVCVTQSFKSFLRNIEIRNIILLLIFSSFMILPISKFVWSNLSFLQRVQFPWRFLTITTICGCLVMAKCFVFFTTENLSKKRPLILLFIGIVLIYSSFSLKQVVLGAAFFNSGEFTTWVENLRNSNGLEHWWTIWTKESAFKEGRKVLADNREIKIKTWEGDIREFSVAAGQIQQARVAILYYPNWQATINGEIAKIQPSEDGAILIDLPSKDSEVKISFVEPEISLLSRKISALAWLSIFFLFLYQILYLRKKHSTEQK